MNGLNNIVIINRAPVLCLWCAVVAREQGFPDEVALRSGSAISSLLARAKGERLGIFRPSEKMTVRNSKEKFYIAGFVVPIEALSAAPSPEKIQSYLERSFGRDLKKVTERFERLASHVPAVEKQAYKLYEQFRPPVARGVEGWAQKGILDLKIIDRLITLNRSRSK